MPKQFSQVVVTAFPDAFRAGGNGHYQICVVEDVAGGGVAEHQAGKKTCPAKVLSELEVLNQVAPGILVVDGCSAMCERWWAAKTGAAMLCGLGCGQGAGLASCSGGAELPDAEIAQRCSCRPSAQLTESGPLSRVLGWERPEFVCQGGQYTFANHDHSLKSCLLEF